jgi:hypothetical protein
MAGNANTRPPRLRYHAVTIVPGPQACELVKSLGNVRLLSIEAPRLPLAGCDRSEQCDCRFQHHSDRRGGPRRAVDREQPGKPAPARERRLGQGRRESDYST